MSATAQEEAHLIARIEHALVLLAYFIELDGDVHLPMFEKFESELADLKRKKATRERAKTLLENYRLSAEIERDL